MAKMLKITVRLKAMAGSPISFSRAVQSKKATGESGDAFEERTWPERLHLAEDGQIFIPPMALKNCLSEVAKYLSESVPGKGKATYTKHFEAGLLVTDRMLLGVQGKDIEGERLFVPADGRRGGGKRVWRIFPIVRSWETTGIIYVLDPVLIDKPDKIREYLEHAGKFIGMGRFRPRNNGYYGRFEIVSFDVEKC